MYIWSNQPHVQSCRWLDVQSGHSDPIRVNVESSAIGRAVLHWDSLTEKVSSGTFGVSTDGGLRLVNEAQPNP